MYLSTKNSNDQNFLAGESINVNVSERTLPQITVIKPDNNQDVINIEAQQTTNFISYNNTFTTGNYRFLSGEKILSIATVNTDTCRIGH